MPDSSTLRVIPSQTNQNNINQKAHQQQCASTFVITKELFYNNRPDLQPHAAGICHSASFLWFGFAKVENSENAKAEVL